MMSNHPTIRWSALCAFLLAGFVLVDSAFAFRMWQNKNTGQTSVLDNVRCDDKDGFTHWRDHTLGWRMNTFSVTGPRLDALGRAMTSWNDVTGSDYVLSYNGPTLGGFGVDGINTVVFTEGAGCVGSCLAITANVLQFGQVIVESDIAARPTVDWSFDGSTPNDVEAMLAHELGHALGIGHSDVGGTPTMAALHNGAAGRALENDDEAALRCSVVRYGIDRPGTDVTYRAHVKGLGWLQQVQNGATGGTTGQSRRMEAAQLRIANGPADMGICYQARVRGKGWMTPTCDGKTTGTVGEGRRMEAIKIWLTRFPEGCSIEYRAHVQGLGWMGWVPYSQVAGTIDEGRRMEAMQVRLLGTCE